MASAFTLKPTHKAVKGYYAALARYADQSVGHEGALRSAFQNLLAETGRKVGQRERIDTDEAMEPVAIVRRLREELAPARVSAEGKR